MSRYLKFPSILNPLQYFKKSPRIGLDIGSDEIRLLQLQKNHAGFHIEKLDCQSLLLKALGEVKMTRWEFVQAELADLVSRSGLCGSRAAIAMPSQVIIRKQIQLPVYFKDQELLEEIRRRLLEYLPGIPEKELYFDFTIRRSADDMHHILLVATRKDHLQQYVEVVTQAGLKPDIVDTDLYALVRAASLFSASYYEDRQATVALLDLHWPVSTFIVYQHEDVIFHHLCQMDKDFLDESLDFMAIFLQQVKHFWQLYTATHPELKIKFIGVAGAMENLDNIAQKIEENFFVRTEVINPFQYMTHQPYVDVEKMNKASPRFLLCCGLAMRNLPAW